MFIVKADTPEAFRNELVQWLRAMESSETKDKKAGFGKRHEHDCEVRALVFHRTAEFWEKIIIKKEI